MKKLMLTATAASFITLSAAALAHHGWNGYESDIRKVAGVIETTSYGNPHGSIRLKSAEKTWEVILAPPSRMTTRGLTADMLKVGATVSVEGYQSTSDEKEMRAERISVDSKTIELR